MLINNLRSMSVTTIQLASKASSKTSLIKALLLMLLVAMPTLAVSATVPADNIDTKNTREAKLPVEDIQRFTTVLEHVKNYYVNPVEDDKLFESAIRGMLAGLDPHSAYLDKEEFEDLKLTTTGKFGGLGIEVTMQDGFIRVISPIDDTPAQKAGVKAGDLIVRLDDTPVKGLSLREAVDKMRGKKGSIITLTIIREKEVKPLIIKVVRDIINVKSVKTKLLDKNYGYIRISNFQNDTGAELINAVKKLKQEAKDDLRGVILDLRNNPGGVLEASVQVADTFLDMKKLKYDGLIVYTKGRMPSSQMKEEAHSTDILNGAPMVILVNSGSASASEIVAGALQDHKRALIVGTKTFGKGSVQTVLPLRDNRGLKLTTALYYTPKGRSIQAEGIIPDIIVEEVLVPEPKDKDKAVNFLVSEKDLENHLELKAKVVKPAISETPDTEKKDDNSIKLDELDAVDPLAIDGKNKDKPLIYRDYQLNEALNILKGMHLSS